MTNDKVVITRALASKPGNIIGDFDRAVSAVMAYQHAPLDQFLAYDAIAVIALLGVASYVFILGDVKRVEIE